MRIKTDPAPRTRTRAVLACALALVIIPALARAAKPAPFVTEPYFVQERWLEIDGAKILYLDEGQGDAMLLVHGWAGNAWNWMSVFPALARGHRVIALDLPGHGKSGCPKDFAFTAPAYADFLIRVMDQLKIDKATLVGSSMGGAITAWAAINHPDRVSRLILVDAAGTSVQNPMMKAAGGLMTPGNVIPIIHLVFPVNEKNQANVPVSEQKRVTLAEQLYASDRKKCAGRALSKSMKSMSKDIVDSRLGEVRAPTLVIWGSNDGLLPRSAGELYRDQIPGAQLVIIEGGDHTSMQWKPEEFLKVVDQFMAAT
jgi:pimeloyl-ACP methyl ester carboxylesterase